MKSNFTYLILLLIILVGIGIWKGIEQKLSFPPRSQLTFQKESPTPVISYQGEDGKTALQLLERNHSVEATTSNLGAFIRSIDGLGNSESEYWMFYVNNSLSPLAADKYITKNYDKIEWRYQKVK